MNLRGPASTATAARSHLVARNPVDNDLSSPTMKQFQRARVLLSGTYGRFDQGKISTTITTMSGTYSYTEARITVLSFSMEGLRKLWGTQGHNAASIRQEEDRISGAYSHTSVGFKLSESAHKGSSLYVERFGLVVVVVVVVLMAELETREVNTFAPKGF
ncbi:hypothetical protein M0804_014606 [Polistes exclamans]|nr:hypothetical protein M0804_014608 [Polistes exclamans]KAI4474916.1 hypothetical protein M0804_014606 [Polistes exclamans]